MRSAEEEEEEEGEEDDDEEGTVMAKVGKIRKVQVR
jgi:hypothetical protein